MKTPRLPNLKPVAAEAKFQASLFKSPAHQLAGDFVTALNLELAKGRREAAADMLMQFFAYCQGANPSKRQRNLKIYPKNDAAEKSAEALAKAVIPPARIVHPWNFFKDSRFSGAAEFLRAWADVIDRRESDYTDRQKFIAGEIFKARFYGRRNPKPAELVRAWEKASGKTVQHVEMIRDAAVIGEQLTASRMT